MVFFSAKVCEGLLRLVTKITGLIICLMSFLDFMKRHLDGKHLEVRCLILQGLATPESSQRERWRHRDLRSKSSWKANNGDEV